MTSVSERKLVGVLEDVGEPRSLPGAEDLVQAGSTESQSSTSTLRLVSA